ncbi:hypothetical protein APHAL10511_008277 [Amanita phalloides]|nr:hypothetical protein APHAL10511_008277 [Amanita phalloides]
MFVGFPQEERNRDVPGCHEEPCQIAPDISTSNIYTSEIPESPNEKTALSNGGTWSIHMLTESQDHIQSAGSIDPYSIDEVLVGLGLPGLLSAGSIQATGSDSQEPQTSGKPSNPRRPKPRIELAPGQPPTTQGKARSRVYVACLQCRMRKIRCDGAKPVCHNCNRRANSECEYDSLPKRRGPDRIPGVRQRIVGGSRNQLTDASQTRRRRRVQEIRDNRLATSGFEDISINPLVLQAPDLQQQKDNGSITALANPSKCRCHNAIYCPALVDSAGFPFANELETPHDMFCHAMTSLNTGARSMGRTGDRDKLHETEAIVIDSGPSLIFTRRVWWDSLLSLYASSTFIRHEHIKPAQRDIASWRIISDLRFGFRVSNDWHSFFHVPTFFANLCDPTRRESMQPCLVLALLAMATFWQSSEAELGEQGRMRALRFRDEAQAALEASISSRWIDETVVQAAWVLAFFEICAHPKQTSTRAISALNLLDSLIRSLALTLIDVDEPDTSLFTPRSIPTVYSRLTLPYEVRTNFSSVSDCSAHHTSTIPTPNTGCGCKAITLKSNWPLIDEYVPLWGLTPTWDMTWSASEIRKESCRRLCWSSMILAAGHVSYISAIRADPIPDLFISNPANYALLFSGESTARSPTFSLYQSSKDTIWALHERSHLLWHSCARMRSDKVASDAEKAQFATKAWLEADALEAALNRHTCDLERAYLFHARECLFNTRMCISNEYQRWVPLATTDTSGLFHRGKAEEWLTHEAAVARGLRDGLHTVTGIDGNVLFRRPYFVFWFMGQINRAISLWEYDQTLIIALDACKAFITVTDYLTSLWPCPCQRLVYDKLRQKVDYACHLAGVCPPPPYV